jgi:2-oxo-4-hydroxy-4-carboxy--5-ureidoimidazoline (OHCU) decarboxylase
MRQQMRYRIDKIALYQQYSTESISNSQLPFLSSYTAPKYHQNHVHSQTMASDEAPITLPPISYLPSLPTTSRTKILDLLFEPSTALHTLSLPLTTPDSPTARDFESYDDLIIAIGLQLTELAESTSTSDTEWLDKILGAHPRLGEKKVDSALSRGEQAAMNKASGGEGRSREDVEKEQEILRALNEKYESKFPGLRYVVFVNGRSRPVIFEDMRRRIERGDIGEERKEAIKVCCAPSVAWTSKCQANGRGIQAMCDIASDRAKKLQ